MPKRQDIKSILIIGAGPIVIGQACEFDYSGAQACKALREEGFRVILVNSNPATIMTDPKMADATYIEPIEWKTVEKIIEKSEIEILEQKIIDSCEQGAELLIEAKRGKFDNYWKYSQQKDTRDNIIQLLKEYKDAINTLEINNPSTKT